MGVMTECWCFGYNKSIRIGDKLKTIHLSGKEIEWKRVAIVNLEWIKEA